MAFTFFFRDRHTLDTIVDHLIPFVTGRSKIRIWDAGCASGEEPYTLMVLLAEKMGRYSFKNVKIQATDIDISNQFGEIINKGIYPYERVQRIPRNLLTKYFRSVTKDDSHFQVIDDLRSKINFRQENLCNYQPTGSGFSLVLCKNVLLHQTYEQRVNILNMFHESLLEGGLLAMEQTQKLPSELSGRFKQLVNSAQIFKKL